MVNALLPRALDNDYRGHKLAIWLFALVVAVRTVQSVIVIFTPYSTAMKADGLPLDTYPAAASQAIVTQFALYALSRLIISLLCVIVLVRYRSAIPLMFGLVLVNYAAVQVILRFLPLARRGTPPAAMVNRTLIAMSLVGFALSLWKRR